MIERNNHAIRALAYRRTNRVRQHSWLMRFARERMAIKSFI